MERLTKHTPQGNFETMMNYVYGRDGWAYLRSDREHDDVLLTDWVKQECIKRGCTEISDGTPQEIDQAICDCALDFGDCPVFLAYTFAVQAVHLRDRLLAIEDVLGEDYDLVRLTALVKTRDEGETGMQFTAGDTVWVVECDEDGAPCDVSGYVFLTETVGYAIISPTINGSSDINDIFAYAVESTARDYHADFEVYPIADCYSTRAEAESALERGVQP